VKSLAQEVVDVLLDENWFSDRWADVKELTGLGQDSMGLGKNTEKGWKPSYARSAPPTSPEAKEKLRKARKSSQREPGEKVWELD